MIRFLSRSDAQTLVNAIYDMQNDTLQEKLARILVNTVKTEFLTFVSAPKVKPASQNISGRFDYASAKNYDCQTAALKLAEWIGTYESVIENNPDMILPPEFSRGKNLVPLVRRLRAFGDADGKLLGLKDAKETIESVFKDML